MYWFEKLEELEKSKWFKNWLLKPVGFIWFMGWYYYPFIWCEHCKRKHAPRSLCDGDDYHWSDVM
jgi:hypothetical protein